MVGTVLTTLPTCIRNTDRVLDQTVVNKMSSSDLSFLYNICLNSGKLPDTVQDKSTQTEASEGGRHCNY